MKRKLNTQKNISTQNQARVLHEICTNKLISRIDIAKKTGLSSMTITNIVNRFITEEIVVEIQEKKGDAQYGRKPILLDLSENSPCIIGINFTRATIKAVLSDYKANILATEHQKIGEISSQEDFLSLVLDVILKILNLTTRKIIGIGVSSFGPVDIESGTILNVPNFYNLSNIPVVHFIQDKTKIKTYFVHDSNAAAIAENLYGRVGGKDFLFLRIADGVGGGLFLNQQIYNGSFGMSGEIGHISLNIDGPQCSCGNKGCLENYINTNLFTNAINEKHHFDPPLNWEDIVSLYNSNQNLFSDFFDQFCNYIALACINIINILDIPLIILEYRGQSSGNKIEENIEKFINNHLLANHKRHISVIKSKLNNDAALIGAVSVILNKIFNSEIDYH